MNTPWWLKICVKIVIKRLPISYAVFNKIGIFKHGYMDDPEYSISVFDHHFKKVKDSTKNLPLSSILELGPGDSVSSALIAYDRGISGPIWMIDTGAYATKDQKCYENVYEALGRKPIHAKIQFQKGLTTALKNWNAHYLTSGIESFKLIPDESIDYCFSQAVLEHIRKKDIEELIFNFRRILRPGGFMSHQIDLKDHLGGGLNNLRFTDRLWEADWFANSGFYTNRLSVSEWLAMFENNGFSILENTKTLWEVPPINRSKLASPYHKRNEDELLCSGFYCLLKKK